MSDYAYAIAYSRKDADSLGRDGWRAVPGSFSYGGHTNERTGEWIEDIAILMERTVEPEAPPERRRYPLLWMGNSEEPIGWVDIAPSTHDEGAVAWPSVVITPTWEGPIERWDLRGFSVQLQPAVEGKPRRPDASTSS